MGVVECLVSLNFFSFFLVSRGVVVGEREGGGSGTEVVCKGRAKT